jgi:hypothetical protein
VAGGEAAQFVRGGHRGGVRSLVDTSTVLDAKVFDEIRTAD